MGIRHEAREWALQFLFQSEFNRDDSLDEGLRHFWEHQDEPPSAADARSSRMPSAQPGTDALTSPQRAKARRFAEELARGVIAHHQEIDEHIVRHAANWDIDRMGNVDRNVMRMAVFEMLYRDDIPPVVSINEAVDLAKAYSSTESGKFVNGILDRIRMDIDRPARAPGAGPRESAP